MLLSRVSPPSVLPVSREEAKAHCRVVGGDEDDLFDGLIDGVVEYLDGPAGILGWAIMEQVWMLELASWPVSALALPVEPVSSVTITYFDTAGAEQTLPVAAYRLDSTSGAESVLHMTGTGDLPSLQEDRAYPVRVSMTAGVATAEDVESGLKVLIKMLIAHWFENREAVVVGPITSEMPMAASALLARYRRKL